MARTVGLLAAWIGVAAIATMLTAQRFAAAVQGGPGTDLAIFLDAARQASAGESVYRAEGYVYLPFLAWALRPVSSLPDDVVFSLWTALSLSASLGTVAIVTATVWVRCTWWQRPVVAGVGVITLLFNNVMTIELWLGQSDTFVLLTTALAALAATRRKGVVSGLMLAAGAVLKTWPVAFGVWLLRRDAPRRARSMVGALGGGVVLLLLVVVASGPATIGDWIRRTVELSAQPRVAYSVWGLGRQAFADAGVMTPLLDAPVLGEVVSWALAAGVVALVVVALRRPGSDSFSLWNVAAATIMLIPVSHVAYRLLLLPLVWMWTASALRTPREPWTVATAAVGFGMWVVTFRVPPLDSEFAHSTPQYLSVMFAGLGFLALSVFVAARMDSAARADQAYRE